MTESFSSPGSPGSPDYPDIAAVASAFDTTGLMPALPLTEDEYESRQENSGMEIPKLSKAENSAHENAAGAFDPSSVIE